MSLVTLLCITVVASLGAAAWVGRRLRHRSVAVGLLAGVAGGLTTALALWLLVAGLLLAAAVEVWPLSRRQGPDTAFSRTCYAELLGAMPPAGVTQTYCRREWGFGGDGIDTLRFRFRDDETLRTMIARMGLEAIPAHERSRVRYFAAPEWWPDQSELSRVRDVYHRGNREFLWVEPTSGEAYFQRAFF